MPDFNLFNNKLSDLEFLRQKELDGDLIKITGTNSGTGDTVSYVPVTGKTFFLISASLTVESVDPFATQHSVRVELQNDGTTRDGWFHYHDNSPSELSSLKNDFNMIGDSLVGDSAKAYSIDIISNSFSETIRGTIVGWIEDT